MINGNINQSFSGKKSQILKFMVISAIEVIKTNLFIVNTAGFSLIFMKLMLKCTRLYCFPSLYHLNICLNCDSDKNLHSTFYVFLYDLWHYMYLYIVLWNVHFFVLKNLNQAERVLYTRIQKAYICFSKKNLISWNVKRMVCIIHKCMKYIANYGNSQYFFLLIWFFFFLM